MPQRTFLHYFVITAKGLAMGAADVVPGVSGGTIAFISGIYEELIETINKLDLGIFKMLKKEGVKAAWKHYNLAFLLALFSGVAISVLSLSKLITYLLATYPLLVWGFFFGLVIASILYVGTQVSKWDMSAIVSLVVAAGISYLITIAEPVGTPDSIWFLFFAGCIAIIAMILPGISGAFILLLLGAYTGVMNIINTFREGIKQFNWELLSDALLKISVFALGAIVGLKLFSKVLNWLFQHKKNTTLAILTGFMIGALNKIWPWKEVLSFRTNSDGKQVPFLEKSILPTSFEGDPKIVLTLVFVVIGFLTIFLLERFASQQKSKHMASQRTLADKLWLVFKGLTMGAANKVPGVSGGVVAFVAGFYEEFIYSLQKINRKALLLLLNGRFRSFGTYINGSFLGLLVLGMIISYFSVSKVLDYLIVHYELYVWSSFFGMIIGSIYYIAKDFGQWNRRYIAYLLLGITLGIAISFLEPATQNDNLIFVFFCGIIGVSGMTLPGLSGSFILILLGNYVLLLVDSVNALYDTIIDLSVLNFEFTDDPVRIRLLQVLTSFSLGSVVGLVSLSHLLGYVLKRYKKATYAVIIGFITGSLGVVWPWKEKDFVLNETGEIAIDAYGREIIKGYHRFWPSEFSTETICAIAFVILGILIVLSLDWYYKIRKKLQ